MFRTVALAVALACVPAANSAMAAEVTQNVQGRVSVAGLDLSDPADRAELQERIERKGRKLCTRGLHRDFWDSQLVKDCRASVAASASQELSKLSPTAS